MALHMHCFFKNLITCFHQLPHVVRASTLLSRNTPLGVPHSVSPSRCICFTREVASRKKKPAKLGVAETVGADFFGVDLETSPRTESSQDQEDEEVEEFFDYDDDYVEPPVDEPQYPIPLTRGKSGVFDIEDLVDFLRSENAQSLCTVQVPKEYNYVDYLIVASAISSRHSMHIMQQVLKVYKLRKSKSDPFPVIEGKKQTEWLALDLGNIALHVFGDRETRQKYDLEMLWTVGPEYDDKVFLSNREQELSYRQYLEPESAGAGFNTVELDNQALDSPPSICGVVPKVTSPHGKGMPMDLPLQTDSSQCVENDIHEATVHRRQPTTGKVNFPESDDTIKLFQNRKGAHR